MKLSSMNPRERRTVTWGAAIVIASLGWVYGLRPIRASLTDLNDQIVVERQALAREQSAVLEATRSPARKRIADSALTAAVDRMFSGANDVAAGAELVSYLGQVARRTNVWLANAATRAAPTSAGSGVAGRGPPATRPAAGAAALSGLHALSVEIRAESDFHGVLDFLDALERGNKVVTVERLDIARTLRVGDEDRETLTITATVVGYALPRVATAPSDAQVRAARDSAGGAP